MEIEQVSKPSSLKLWLVVLKWRLKKGPISPWWRPGMTMSREIAGAEKRKAG